MWKQWFSDLTDLGLETLLVALGLISILYFLVA
jgi:hypothetical protein